MVQVPTEISWPVLRDHWMAEGMRKAQERNPAHQAEGRFLVTFLPCAFALMENERTVAGDPSDKSGQYAPIAFAAAIGLCLALMLPHMAEPENREALATKICDLIRAHCRQKTIECGIVIEALTRGVQ